ncbi:MAG: hypothetical protein ACK56F_11370 [bacterium]|jgi:hypothetical protein
MISRYILDEETGENMKVYVKKDKATKEEIDAHENRKGIEILESPKALTEEVQEEKTQVENAQVEETYVEKVYLEETPKAQRDPQ